MKTSIWIGVISIAVTPLAMIEVCGQDYPSRPIRIITSEAGGANDFTARLIAQGISSPLGQPVVIDNRPTIIAGESVSKAQPDGYTVLTAGSVLWIGPLLDKLPYDPVRDFSPITLAASSPNVLVVHPLLPVKSVSELIALAKTRPGMLNYGSGAIGAGNHLAAELFKSMASVNIVRVPYKGGAQALTDLLSGQLQLMFSGVLVAIQQVKPGKLRALAVTSAQPSTLMPDVPTVAASGLRGYEATAMTGIFLPAKTPDVIIKRLHQEIVRVLNQSDVKQKLLSSGIEAAGTSSLDFAAKLNLEMVRMGKVIKDANIRLDK